jgi:hypothetical protein
MRTGFLESTVHQVRSQRLCKKPQMAWTPRGAHLLLPIRTRVFNGDWEATCREWPPGFRVAPPPVAACPPRINRSSTADRCVQRRRQDLIRGVRT